MTMTRSRGMAKVVKSWLTAFSLALASLALPARSDILNILTVDMVQKGYGDLVSNWSTALALAASDPELTVNFYLSEPFQERFKRIEPGYDYRTDAPTRQRLHNVNVFTTPPPPANVTRNADARLEWNDRQIERSINLWLQAWLPANTDQHVCTVAFTVPLATITRSVAPEAGDTLTTPVGRRMIQLIKSRLPQDLKTVQERQVSPFLAYDYFTVTGPHRFMSNGGMTDQVNFGPANGLPKYGMRSTFSNGAMFLSRYYDPLPVVPYQVDTDFLGYAYSANVESTRRYLMLVAAFAKSRPEARILVIIPAHKSADLFGGQISSHWKWATEKLTSTPIRWSQHPGTRGFAHTPTPGDLYRLEKNLYVLHVPQGISFRDVTAVMKSVNIPVLVTGTSSLAVALQYDRPFLYEALPHHRGSLSQQDFSAEIEDTLRAYLKKSSRQPDPRTGEMNYDAMLYSLDFKATFPMSLPDPKDARGGLPVAASVLDTLFDTSHGQAHAPTLNPRRVLYSMFDRDNYAAVERAIHHYRTKMQDGFIMDRVLDDCDIGRTAYVKTMHEHGSALFDPTDAMCDFEWNLGSLTLPEVCD